MPNLDGTGPCGQGPQTGKQQGLCNDEEIIKDVVQDTIKPVIYDQGGITLRGPGGHIPNGTGPYGRGMGPGKGRGCA